MQTLEQLTPTQINDEAARLNRLYGADGGLKEYYAWIRGLRRECFERLVAAMDPTGQLTDWEGQMIAKHGPKVQLHGITYSWKAALAVGLFGEDPNAVHAEGHWRAVDSEGNPAVGVRVWPETFAEDHVIRAKRWLYDNNAPDGITYITREG